MIRHPWVLVWTALLTAGPAVEAQSADGFVPVPDARVAGRLPRFHDPSTPVKDGESWWIFATGRGIALRRSPDLKSWSEDAPVFLAPPAWHREVVADHDRNLWAPDVVRHNGQFRLYYSVSSFGKNTSAIGLATSLAVDPKNPQRDWQDRGIVVKSGASDSFNAIDPHVLIDDDGRHWMSFGSFWKGIFLLELDPETGLRHPRRGELRHLAWNKTIEAPAILKHGGFYYLFVNWGVCCRGVDSTYEIRIGRSRAVTGPYLDRDGSDLATGGGTLLLQTEGDRIGPGHASFVTRDGVTVMFYHYYDRSRRGQPSLAWKRIAWAESGWPELRN